MERIEVDLGSRLVYLNLKALQKTQAVWRGWFVRKQIAGVRQAFIQTVGELDDLNNLDIEWHAENLPCKPSVKRKAQTQQAKSNSKKQTKVSAESQTDSDLNTDTELKQYTKNQSDKNGSCENSDGDLQVQQDVRSQNDQGAHSSEHGQVPQEKVGSLSDKSPSSVSERGDRDSGTSGNVNGRESSTSYGPSGESKQGSPFLHDSTSAWDTMDATRLNASNAPGGRHKSYKDMTADELGEERSSVAMELLWVQQAINSRKQYLRLKTQMAE